MLPQNIDWIYMSFYKPVNAKESEDDISNLFREYLTDKIVHNQYPCKFDEEFEIDPDENIIYYSVSIQNLQNGKPLYENYNIDYEPYTPARMYLSNGDPGYPAEGGVIGGYDNIYDYLKELKFNAPDGWDYEVRDYEMDSLDYLWNKYCEGE